MRTKRIPLVALVAAVILFPVQTASGTSEKCSRQHVRKLVHTFIAAYNEGAFRKLDRIFADSSDFHFYRVFPERQWPSSDDRNQLIPYFRERYAHNDHLELVEFKLDRKRAGMPRMWGFQFMIERTSDEPAPWANGTLSGKGSAECSIAMWNASWRP